MAIAITQQPTEWNLAYLPNIYGFSTSTGLAQIQVEVEGNIVATVKQSENPGGVSLFDVSKILQSHLAPHIHGGVEEIPRVHPSHGEVITYRVKYAEVVPGEVPVYFLGAVKYVVNGYDNWRALNWDNSPFRTGVTEVECESPGYDGLITEKRFLTNFPTEYTIRHGEYHTLSFFNWFENYTLAQFQDQPYFVDIKHYNSAGSLITQYNYSISEDSGLGPRLNCNDLGPYTFTSDQTIGHVGVGTANLASAGLLHPASVRYTITLYSLNGCYYGLNGPISDCEDTAELVDNYGQVEYQATFNIEQTCSPFEPIRLSFLNQYGVKDYFTFDRRNTYSVMTGRTNYQQVLGTWSDAVFSIPTDGRGTRTYSSAITETMTLSTNWMTDQVSEWLQELYTSPYILMYKDGQWEPCVITTQQYEEKTNARNRMFQHTINIEYSNNKTVQRG